MVPALRPPGEHGQGPRQIRGGDQQHHLGLVALCAPHASRLVGPFPSSSPGPGLTRPWQSGKIGAMVLPHPRCGKAGPEREAG